MLETLYSDDQIVVVVKPGGLLAVPGRGPGKQDCVSSRLRAKFPEMIVQPAVHRLDMYTSGVMVYAITQAAHRNLSKQFERREVVKIYEAVVEGKVSGEHGKIVLPFRLNPEKRPLQIYDPEKGKTGITLWKKISGHSDTSRLEFTPLTGRTHQLRVHAAHEKGLGCPIVGDSLYGSGLDGDQMMLHAVALQFTHPATGELVNFSSNPLF